MTILAIAWLLFKFFCIGWFLADLQEMIKEYCDK